jgi:Spy/CpxP family protein refolding chaperone
MMLATALVGLGLVGVGAFVAMVGLANAQLAPPPTIDFRLDAVGLARSPQIKMELEITDAQAQKLVDARPESLAKILNEKQLLRLHQIELQRRGLPALVDKDLGAALKLTDEQAKSIKKIVDDWEKDRREAFPPGTKSSLGERMAKIEGMKKAAFDKAQTVLSADQKKTWTDLNGAPFHLQLPFTGGNPKKKG